MPQFAFYRTGAGVRSPLSLVEAESIDEAKRQAIAAIEAEGLDAIRVWIDGQQTIEMRRPSRPAPIARPTPADDRGARMASMKATGASYRDIGESVGISGDRVAQIIATAEARARLRDQEPNRASLPVRVRTGLLTIIEEPETDPAERDMRLPGRLAALTRREIEKVPNLGKRTIAELEAWLWTRGLTFRG